MAAIHSLIHLIRSLSKAEKKNFSMYAAGNEKNRAYLRLYDTISKNNLPDEEVIKTCRNLFRENEFSSHVSYLYEVLMKSLTAFHLRLGTDEKLLSGIQEVKILFRKGLSQEGFILLDTLRKMAVKYEKFAYCIILDKLLLHYLNRYQFLQLSEDELLRVQSELRKHIQYELNLAEHSSLYELLNYRFLIQGSARSTKDKDKLNDLVFTEMNLAGNPRFQSFDLKKNHLLFQSVYFMMVGDHKSSLQTFYELNTLFEQHRPFWTDAPLYYVQHVRGILNNLHLTGQYTEMDFFIGKLENLKNEHSFLSLYQTIFVSNIKKMLGENQLEMVDNYIGNHFDLIEKSSLMNPVEKSETLFYVALTRFSLKDMKGAAKVLNELIHFHDLPNRHMFRLIRLINLILHFEMHNFVYLESGIRSLERELKQSKRSFLTEQVILKMLRKYPLSLSKSSRKKLLELTYEELEQLKNNTYEMQLFHIFDFCNWLKRKI